MSGNPTCACGGCELIDLTDSVGRKVWVGYRGDHEPEILYDIDACFSCEEHLPKQPRDPDFVSVAEALAKHGIYFERVEVGGAE